MAGETVITFQGNVVNDPELRFTPSGAAVANFRVASTPRTFDRTTNEWTDGEPLFLGVSVWRQQAEHVADSVQKGARVIIVGRLVQRQYEKDGQRRSSYEIQADEVAVSLKTATATVTKANGQRPQQGYETPQAEPWNVPQQPGSAQWGTVREPPF